MTSLRILVLSDEPCKLLWEYYRPETFKGIDLIISCGDLPADYLTFIATVFRGPVLYVHGNHDAKYDQKPPEGCICIEDEIYTYKGVRILGLGGSHKYNGTRWQFTQKEMTKRVRRLWYPLFRNKGFDILVTHSPAFGVQDGKDWAHQGFRVFNELIEKYQPKLFLYGHVHLNYGDHARECRIGNTLCVNGFERYVIDYKMPQ
ncbi:metallophosphoesterase [uncultured Dubosiella sp.]|uniref:metallophosphoesterase family protein n=1 Tax=uncultured Dubosiella sp. TaxID=1937011 RepID=UPI0027322125|nr:metallophosphoesterase [uncultured Dubosiella sp.]